VKCRACGYIGFEPSDTCGNCGAPTAAAGAPPPSLPLQQQLPLGPQLAEAAATAPPPRQRKARRSPVPNAPKKTAAEAAGRGVPPGEAPETLEVSDRDLDLPRMSRSGCPAPGVAASVPAAGPAAAPAPLAIPLSYPPDGGEPALPWTDAAVIDRVEEVPERFWAPDGAGLFRRATALLVDLALLAFLLGLFLLGGAFALWREGIETATLLSGPGLRVTRVPVALLAALLSLATHVPFHALAGTTPGKRLAGLEVRSGDGSPPTWTEAALRWLGAALVVLSGGAGAAWALFEPRRRGWADLLSRTMVVARAPGRPTEDGVAR
jgi:uncharacterized RDD family membrane protein YckC